MEGQQCVVVVAVGEFGMDEELEQEDSYHGAVGFVVVEWQGYCEVVSNES